MPARPIATKDNAVGRLNAGIAAGTTTIPLQAGQGTLFPTTKNGSATSTGSKVLLNSTGIQALGVAVGDIIENVTDGSYAVVSSVATNSVVTSPLRGGTTNIWTNAHVWAVNRFVLTIIQYDVDGVTILKREKILIKTRATDTLTVETSGRGYDGSTALSFNFGDYCYVLWTDVAHVGLKVLLADILVDVGNSVKATMSEIYGIDTVGTDDYVVTIAPAPTALTDGMAVLFKPGTANTGASTINVNGLGAKAIRKNYNTVLQTGDIVAQQRCIVVYDAANDWFQLISWPGVAGATTTSVQNGDSVYAADAQANDTYVITLSPVPAGYVAGQHFKFKANTLNTGAATLNVNSLGAITIKKGLNTDLETGDIVAGQIVEVVYDGTNFIMTSPPSQLVNGGTITGQHFHKKGFGVANGNGSTTQTIAHGLGVTPKIVRFTVLDGVVSSGIGLSFGISNGSQHAMVWFKDGGNDTTSTTVVMQSQSSVTGTVTALDATNITITWSSISNTGIPFVWEADV